MCGAYNMILLMDVIEHLNNSPPGFLQASLDS